MQPTFPHRIRQFLGSPVDAGSMAAFRIGFGGLMAWLIYGFLRHGTDGRNFVELLFTAPGTTWTCPHPWLDWLHPYPEPWTTVLFGVCLLSACLVAVGLMYRVASVVLCLTYWHIVLMDATLAGNHFPLLGVFAVLLAVIPAHRRYSLDRLIVVGLWRRRRPTTVGFWAIFVMRAQTFLIYFYGGVSKIHGDWLAGQPIRMWFSAEGLRPFLDGKLSAENAAWLQAWMASDLIVYTFSYGGLVFDLVIGVLLIVRRTRWFAFALVTFFHTFNFSVIEHVGLVAPAAFWATLTFFEPDWPTRLWHFVRHPRLARPDLRWLVAGAVAVPGIGALLGWKAKPRTVHATPVDATLIRWPLLWFCVGWLTLQTLVPVRHFLMPGDPYWTDRGVRYSWFLMARNKVAGFARFRVEDPRLVRDNAAGQSQFDWDRYQGPKPPVVYVQIDARTVRWSQLPEVFVTFEPMIGERIFFNPAAAGLTRGPEIEAHVHRLWQDTYGRTCSLLPTYPLPQRMRTLNRHAAIAVREEEPGAESFQAVVLQAEARAQQLFSAGLDDDAFHRRLFSFKDSLFAFRQLGAYREELLQVIVQTSPFALQGHDGAGPLPMLIHDPKLIRQGLHLSIRLQRNIWQGESTTYADFDAIPWQFMRGLPRILPVYRLDDTPGFIWNYSVELNPHQIETVGLLPLVFYQYAAHIADVWQAEQGHRPSVFGTSYVILNDRPMQKIIDPDVDLASTPHDYFGEHPWILPPPVRPTAVSQDEVSDDPQPARR